MTACIIGWKHLPFGRLEGRDVESLIVEAVIGALDDAQVGAEEVDEIFVGHFGGPFVRQGFTAPLALQADAALRFKPATRVENACATGSAAVFGGLRAIKAKDARIVVVVGVEKMTELAGAAIGDALLTAAYLKEEDGIDGGFAGVFGGIAQRYFQENGDQSDALATIAAKNHRNGCANPYAQMRKDLGYRFCREVSDRNPVVAGPLKRTDCSLVSDGAAALVMADLSTGLAMRKAVVFRAATQVCDFMPISRRDITAFEGCAKAWHDALDQAQLTLQDLDLVETHDCFTIAELIELEAMGLTPRGRGAHAVLEGWTQKDGRLPVNPSGGLKSKGHPIGATGVSMHVLTAMQLRGEADRMQIDGASIGGIYNMGGACVASYVSLLEAIR